MQGRSICCDARHSDAIFCDRQTYAMRRLVARKVPGTKKAPVGGPFVLVFLDLAQAWFRARARYSAPCLLRVLRRRGGALLFLTGLAPEASALGAVGG
jgi:hypothetical protein